ncbi:ABC transporter ATP-binding protein [Tropicimonas sp. IMCC6043]|uniref:ABC transporter ATP-binding protein n=1 Tax=Tropicimonas sp. IMCC6043 TaxID=2510645 RepID=UPI00101D1F2D|nr:ABC transporter ATP-binding protein [Tropicimonas sp. IMCC6043]RYH10103.1 ABC transporter ATP-binding protein [Tropicimonas sp. IMCC6043]
MRQLLLAALRPRLWKILFASLLVIAGSLVTLIIPWALGQIAGALVDRASGVPVGLLLGLLLTIAVQSLLALASSVISQRVTADVLVDLRRATFSHVLRLPLAFHESHPRGSTVALLGQDVDFLGEFSAGFVTLTAPRLVTLIGAAVLMIRIDPLLAAPVLLTLPVAIATFRLLTRRLRPLGRDYRDQEARVISIIDESLAMVPTMKRFAREPQAIERFENEVERARVLSTRLHLAAEILQPAVQVLTGMALLLVVVVLQSRLDALALSTAEWTSLLLYAGMIVRPLAGLSRAWGQLNIARGAFQRLAEAMQLEAEPAPEHSASRRAETRRAGALPVAFDDVWFRYGPDRWALASIDLVIEPGEHVGLIGPNGSGKSSVVRLLSGLHMPERGEVRVGGRATSAQDLAALRQSVAVVPQDVQLLDATIRENIAYGAPGATQAQVRRAAEAALAAGFIDALDRGYDTLVGENGIWLSGGQRQRIALARALICNPGLLILDEATAMFDIDGEAEFFERAREVFTGRTVIVVAHTPQALAAVDRIVTLEGGRVVSDRRARHA